MAIRTEGRRTPRARSTLAVIVFALLPLASCTSAPSAPPVAETSAPPAVAPVGSDDETVLSPITAIPLAEIAPVLGADGRVHLAYELMLANQSDSTVRLSSVATLASDQGDAVLTTVEGAALDRLVRPSAGSGAGLAPGGSGYLFLDATLASDAPLPGTVRHRFAMTLEAEGAPAQPLEFVGVPVRVSDEPAIEVAAPLRGGGWVAGNGCCDSLTAHRGATLSITGTPHAAERFAIDFVQLDPSGRLYTGDPAPNASFPYFGAEVVSATDGAVMRVQDGLPEQVPGQLPEGQTVQTAGGNYIVVDIGGGRFAFYAHRQPGSLRAGVGDQVGTGQVLGLLGNTGNTDAAHLHFHVMDGPSPLQSNGLPFVFTSLTEEGVVTDEAALVSPFPPVAPVVPSTPRRWPDRTEADAAEPAGGRLRLRSPEGWRRCCLVEVAPVPRQPCLSTR